LSYFEGERSHFEIEPAVSGVLTFSTRPREIKIVNLMHFVFLFEKFISQYENFKAIDSKILNHLHYYPVY